MIVVIIRLWAAHAANCKTIKTMRILTMKRGSLWRRTGPVERGDLVDSHGHCDYYDEDDDDVLYEMAKMQFMMRILDENEK